MEMVSRPCPLCGSNAASQVFAPAAFDPARWDAYAFAPRKLPERMHYRLLLCRACQLVYASPAPTLDALARAYRAAAYDSAAEAEFAARTYARAVDRRLQRLPDRNGALDIGAGDGAFLHKLLARGFTGVVGIEPSAAPLAAARAPVRELIRHGLFCGQDFAAETFSLVTCFQTIEHVYDPLQTCRQAFSLLKTGGAMLLVLHNRRALSARMLGLKSPIYDIEHLQLFCPHSARLLLQRAGFRALEIRRIWNRYPLRYWLKLCPLPDPLKRLTVTFTEGIRIGALPLALPAGNMAVIGFKSESTPTADPAPSYERLSEKGVRTLGVVTEDQGLSRESRGA